MLPPIAIETDSGEVLGAPAAEEAADSASNKVWSESYKIPHVQERPTIPLRGKRHPDRSTNPTRRDEPRLKVGDRQTAQGTSEEGTRRNEVTSSTREPQSGVQHRLGRGQGTRPQSGPRGPREFTRFDLQQPPSKIFRRFQMTSRPAGYCFNCLTYGHRHPTCPEPRKRQFCERCGRLNTDRQTAVPAPKAASKFATHAHEVASRS